MVTCGIIDNNWIVIQESRLDEILPKKGDEIGVKPLTKRVEMNYQERRGGSTSCNVWKTDIAIYATFSEPPDNLSDLDFTYF